MNSRVRKLETAHPDTCAIPQVIHVIFGRDENGPKALGQLACFTKNDLPSLKSWENETEEDFVARVRAMQVQVDKTHTLPIEDARAALTGLKRKIESMNAEAKPI
jgi:hypothetical protein